ncbi:hypothetical protein IWX48DRAFT_321399 [Phyllosticta citricarpa]
MYFLHLAPTLQKQQKVPAMVLIGPGRMPARQPASVLPAAEIEVYMRPLREVYYDQQLLCCPEHLLQWEHRGAAGGWALFVGSELKARLEEVFQLALCQFCHNHCLLHCCHQKDRAGKAVDAAAGEPLQALQQIESRQDQCYGQKCEKLELQRSRLLVTDGIKLTGFCVCAVWEPRAFGWACLFFLRLVWESVLLDAHLA